MPYILDFFKVLEKIPQKVHTPKSDFFAITKSLKKLWPSKVIHMISDLDLFAARKTC